MKILYSIPSLESVYANRFVYEGYKNAFLDLGHEFRPFTSNDSLRDVLSSYRPDIFMYSLNFYHLKFIDLEILKSYRKKGLVVFTQIRAWDYVTDDRGSGSLKDDRRELDLIKRGMAGDILWHWFEQDEPLMRGFKKGTSYPFYTIHQAADKTRYFQEYDEKFECDVAYVGSYLPLKRTFFDECVLPLKKQYDLRIYGSDWTRTNRFLGKVQKFGQWFNINSLKKIRGLPLSLEDERKVYSSSKISLNVHEEQVKRLNCEINERTFKILACGGFELVDNVPLLRRFFTEDELVIAESTDDWFEKIEYYLNKPKKKEGDCKSRDEKSLKGAYLS